MEAVMIILSVVQLLASLVLLCCMRVLWARLTGRSGVVNSFTVGDVVTAEELRGAVAAGVQRRGHVPPHPMPPSPTGEQ